MPATANTIDHLTLTRLIEAGAVQEANIVGQPDGWRVLIQCGVSERTLAAKRGAVRVFRKFDTLVSYLLDLGLTRYQVDASSFGRAATPATRIRADASERLKTAHQAAAYAAWLTQEVQAALDDPRPSMTHEEAVADWELERAALLQRADALDHARS
jgi:hypothetical protein